MLRNYDNVVLVLDNRVVPCMSFEMEAAMSSFASFGATFITSFLRTASKHDWIPTPSSIVVAASPQACRLVQLPKSIQDLRDILTPRFDAFETWVIKVRMNF